jgi:hypothetical protein
MEGPTSSGGSRNRLTCLSLQEHDDDYDDEEFYIIRLKRVAMLRSHRHYYLYAFANVRK